VSRARSQADLARGQTSAVEQLLQQPEQQLVRPQLLLGLVRAFRAIRTVSQTGHRVRATPSQEVAGVLRTDERQDRPERAEIPRAPPRVQVELADIQERHEIDDAPFHGERVLAFALRDPHEAPDGNAISGRPEATGSASRTSGGMKNIAKRSASTDDPLNGFSFGDRHRNPPFGARVALHSRHCRPRIACRGERLGRGSWTDFKEQRALHH